MNTQKTGAEDRVERMLALRRDVDQFRYRIAEYDRMHASRRKALRAELAKKEQELQAIKAQIKSDEM